MGIESGSDHIRNKVLCRNISQQQLIDAFRLCKEAGLKIHSFNMVGLPYETLRMMLDTIKINAKLDTDINQVTIFYPYKKTPLYETCIKENLIAARKESLDYIRDTTLKFGYIRRNQIIFIQKYFSILVKVYKSINKLPERFRAFAQWLFEGVVFNWVSCAVFFPVLNSLMVLIWKNKALSKIARMINRRFLKG
jgi:radical SAM superfamily enzyme YgiQ (UPF0313 family)